MKLQRHFMWISALAMGLMAMRLLASQVDTQAFASPEEAMRAMIDAADHNDTAALLKLLGPDSQDIATTGNASEDQDRRAEFARMAHERAQVVLDPASPNRATFSVGNQDWPFPIPLMTRNGKWVFDTAKGRIEILAHRIGRNELDTVEACRRYVEAQLEYADINHSGDGFLEYAQRLLSTSGKQDGLYWEGAPGSLIPKAFAEAAANYPEGTTRQEPYHGYYFHVLKSQGPDAPGGEFSYVVKGDMFGGFALIAWPAQYGVTGIKTFIVNHLGVVYEKDLGPNTISLARQMPRFNPDKTWHRIDLE